MLSLSSVSRLSACIAAMICFLFSVAKAQNIFQPVQPQKKVVPVKIAATLNIDGRLNESAWDSAAMVNDFIEVNPLQGNTPAYPTIVKLLYNDSYFYIAGVCSDNEGKKSIRVPDFKRDFDPGDHDLFAVIVDGFRDKKNAMIFLTNPYGVQRDALAFDDRFFDIEWDGLWKVRTQRTDSGWIAEIAIPWKTLRYPPNKSSFQSWGINFCRQRRSTNEVYTWSPFPRAYSWSRMDYEGLMDSLYIPSSAINIRIQPYALTSAKKEHRSGPWITDIKAGGEIKWAIKSDKVLDLTFNTDFAQADVDQFVNNLQRFSVYFPERRQFFLENASLFNTGLDILPDGNKNTPLTVRPFFSRRIGLDEKGDPIAINAGARYVQRGDKQNIGLMMIRQSASDSLSTADFFIGRYSHSIGKKAQIGTLITSRIQEEATGKPIQGYTNWSATIDGSYRFNQKWQWNGMISGTTYTGKNNKGASAYSQFFYRDNLITAWWNQSYVSQNYNPEIGFVNRLNVINTSPGLYFTARGKWLPKFVRSFGPAIVADVLHTATTGKLEEFTLDIYPVWFNLHSGAYMGMLWKHQYQFISKSLDVLKAKIVPGTYNYNQVTFSYGTDASKKWSINMDYTRGGYYNGHLQYFRIRPRYSPMPQLAFSGGIELYHIHEMGAEKLTDTYYLYNVQTRLSLNPRVQALILYQYNTVNSSGAVNARFSWEYKPLSFLYLVYNSRDMRVNNLKDRSDLAIFKISYLKQF